MVRRDLLKDPKWRKLSSSAKILYIYLRKNFNYKDKSEVSLTYSEMNDMISSKTFSRAIKELEGTGWIEKTKHGGLYGGVCKYRFIGQYKDFYYQGKVI